MKNPNLRTDHPLSHSGPVEEKDKSQKNPARYYKSHPPIHQSVRRVRREVGDGGLWSPLVVVVGVAKAGVGCRSMGLEWMDPLLHQPCGCLGRIGSLLSDPTTLPTRRMDTHSTPTVPDPAPRRTHECFFMSFPSFPSFVLRQYYCVCTSIRG